MTVLMRCNLCGRAHAVGELHSGVAVRIAPMAANINGPIVPADAPRKRLTAQEAMARTKVSYKKTLAYLA